MGLPFYLSFIFVFTTVVFFAKAPCHNSIGHVTTSRKKRKKEEKSVSSLFSHPFNYPFSHFIWDLNDTIMRYEILVDRFLPPQGENINALIRSLLIHFFIFRIIPHKLSECFSLQNHVNKYYFLRPFISQEI